MTSIVFALTLALVAPLAGQSGTESSIDGIVTDPAGAAVPGVLVTATNLQTAATFRCSSDDRGFFVFLAVPTGKYEIAAEHPGFKRFEQTDVEITVGARVRLPIRLPLGNVEETVTVAANSPVVETTRTSFSSTVDRRSIESVPNNGGNFLNLMVLAPGVAAGNGSAAFFTVAGQMSMSSLLVDGADHNGFSAGPVGGAYGDRYLFSQEAIQEFQINTSGYSAEFGRAGSAVVNVVTKAGTNQFHGDTFWYFRDRSLNATGYIEKLKEKPKGPFHVNQFGATGGGPVLRDRLFFYANYDGQRRSEQNLTWLDLPADFTASSDYELGAVAYLKKLANPYIRRLNQDVALAKLDWRISNTHSLRAQWNRHRLNAPNFTNGGPEQAWEHNGTDAQVADTVSGSLTSMLSPGAVHVARFGYVTTHAPQEGNSVNPEAIVSQGGKTVLQVGRVPRLQDNGLWHAEVADTLALVRGRHTPKFGGNVLVEHGRFFSPVNFYGAYKFNSLESFGRSLAGDQAAPGDTFTQAFSGNGTPGIDVHPNYVELTAFAQDTWRPGRGLTFDLGVRYEVQVMSQSSVFNPAPALAAAHVDTSFIPTDTNNLAPRAGFAWSPRADDRLVVRGGYGLYYQRFLGATAARPFFQNGVTTQTRIFTAKAMPAYPATKCGPADLTGAVPNCPAPIGDNDIIMAAPRTYQQPVIHQATVGAEYELARDLALSVTYLRVRGYHLTHWQDINLSEPQIATAGFAGTSMALPYRLYDSSSRPIAGFDRVLLLNTNGFSSYHGVTVHVNKRFSRDFQFSAFYTLSKIIDDNPTLGTLNPGVPTGDAQLLSDSLDPGLDRGPGDSDQRHHFMLTGVWELNCANRLRGVGSTLLRGWSVSAMLAANSGFPYSPRAKVDLNGDRNSATDRAPGVGRNSSRLPAFVSLDARVTRRVRVGSRVVVQVSWDVFNVFNRGNITSVETSQYSVQKSSDLCAAGVKTCLAWVNGFNTPQTASNPRMMQVSAKMIF